MDGEIHGGDRRLHGLVGRFHRIARSRLRAQAVILRQSSPQPYWRKLDTIVAVIEHGVDVMVVADIGAAFKPWRRDGTASVDQAAVKEEYVTCVCRQRFQPGEIGDLFCLVGQFVANGRIVPLRPSGNPKS